VTRLTIRRYPDPALRTPADSVTTFGRDLATLADDLYETMKAAPGVGITAPHCGILSRLTVIELPELGGRRDYVNPQILWMSEDMMTHTEGSVSMPGVTEEVTRAQGHQDPLPDARRISGRGRPSGVSGDLHAARDRPARRHLLDPEALPAKARAPFEEMGKGGALSATTEQRPGRRRYLVDTVTKEHPMAKDDRKTDFSREDDYRDYDQRNIGDGWPYADGPGATASPVGNRGYGETGANFDRDRNEGFRIDASMQKVLSRMSQHQSCRRPMVVKMMTSSNPI
jgi:hypothetical protein